MTRAGGGQTRARLTFGSLLAAVALVLVTVGGVRAADQPTFGTPNATSAFLSGITLRESVTLPSTTTRLDALVSTEGSVRTFVEPVDLPGIGSQDLSYRFDTPSGALIANTVVRLAFRVTLQDGTAFDGPPVSVRYADTRFTWQTLSGQLVTVHWVQGDTSFGQRALGIAQDAIQKASQLLGVTETEPIDFFVYPDQASMYQMLGPSTRENVGGVAFPEIRTLVADIGTADLTDAWVGIVIPHELTHLVFATATDNPYHQPLHWLNEGLAVELSQGYDDASRSSVAQAVADGTLMPLSSLAGQFPTTADRFSLAYDEAVSAVDFLSRQYGRDKLVALIRGYARGLSDDEAFQAGIGVDTAGFEQAWLTSLDAPAPSPFGPAAAPAGPVPPGWGTGSGTGNGVGGPASSESAAGAPGGTGGSGGTSTAVALGWIVVAFALVAIGLGGAALAIRDRRRTP